MNPVRRRKLVGLIMIVAIVGVAAWLVLYALRQNISLFYSPTQVAEGEAPLHHPIRVGGMVVEGSVARDTHDRLSVRFQVTDYKHTLVVSYHGALPDLFREGQGIVALGQLQASHELIAHEILAKHDENYMPPEVQHALDQATRDNQ